MTAIISHYKKLWVRLEQTLDRSGRLYLDEYFLGESRHRNDGPAFIQYHKNGMICQVKYYKHGKLHREGGPALIFYGQAGVAIRRDYYMEGNKIK